MAGGSQMNSTLRVRKALRQFMLKTHPDFFASGDPAKRAANEQALSLVNSLVDGATATKRFSGQLPPVLRITAHYRGAEDAPPFQFQMAVPPALERGGVEAIRKFCSDALLRMLVAAGEAKAEDSGWNKAAKRDEWVVLAALDSDGLKREMLETFMRNPPRRPGEHAGASTKEELAEKATRARLAYWKKRVVVHSAVKLFESEEAIAMLEAFGRKHPSLLARIHDLPVMIVPAAWAAGAFVPPPGTLLVSSEDSVETLVKKVEDDSEQVRRDRSIARQNVQNMLDCCDVVMHRGHLAGLTVSKQLLLSPKVCHRLIVLLESPMLPLLRGCSVAVSETEGPQRHWLLRAARLVTVGSETVPLVQVAIGRRDMLSGREVLAAQYAISHARKRAAMVNAIGVLSEKCSIRLRNNFHNVSLRRQLGALQCLAEFVDELQPEGSSKARLTVRLGGASKKVVMHCEEGILELPLLFGFEDVRAALLKQ